MKKIKKRHVIAKLKLRRASNTNKRLKDTIKRLKNKIKRLKDTIKCLKDTIQRLKKKQNKLELKCETEILALREDIESLKANEHKLIIREMLYFLEEKIFRILHPELIQPDVHFKLRDILRAFNDYKNDADIRAATIRCETFCEKFPFLKLDTFQCQFRNKITNGRYSSSPNTITSRIHEQYAKTI